MPNQPTDNVSDAENQQERLVKTGWIVGFVEGEGCFSVGFIKQPNREKCRGYKSGIQVWCEFAVTQGESGLHALEEIQNFFGVGNIYLNKRYDSHKEHLYRYVVRRREDLTKVIIPFFSTYPMYTIKKDQFEKFKLVLKQIVLNRHLSCKGVIELAQIAQTMNTHKDRSDLIRILREHMPYT